MHAICRDDLHGRLVVELPGKVFVMGTTPQEVVDRLKQMGVTVTSVTRHSLVKLATSPEIRRDVLGKPLFVDRGDRLTFDREHVSDEAIVECLLEAKSRFGGPLVLTGDCPIFKRRMARLAAERGIEVDNPELQHVIQTAIRDQRAKKVVALATHR
jgi:Large polyvalent protein-associated domain 7